MNEVESMNNDWVPVRNYEGYYEISSSGHVRSLHGMYPRLLAISLLPSGYCHVKLSKNKKSKTIYLHRLIAEHFVDNPEGKPHVNHKDRDPTNNDYSNLEWVTPKENKEHSARLGTKFTKLSPDDVLEIRRLRREEHLTYQKIGERFGVVRSTISEIINGNRWTHVKEKE